MAHSQLLQGDLVAEVVARKVTQDLIVVGSASVAQTLIAHDLVDEFRLKVFPLVIGAGTRLFDDGTPVELELISTERSGAAALLTYQRPREHKKTSPDHAVGARDGQTSSCPRPPMPAQSPPRRRLLQSIAPSHSPRLTEHSGSGRLAPVLTPRAGASALMDRDPHSCLLACRATRGLVTACASPRATAGARRLRAAVVEVLRDCL